MHGNLARIWLALAAHHAQTRVGDRRAAMAASLVDALLGIDQALRHALRGKHQVALVVFIRPAQGDAVGVRDTRDAADEAVRQFVERRACWRPGW